MASRWQVIHAVGCGGIAFYALRAWQPGEIMCGEDAIALDGTHPMNGDAMRCGSCGEKLNTGELEFGEVEDA